MQLPFLYEFWCWVWGISFGSFDSFDVQFGLLELGYLSLLMLGLGE